MKIGPLSAEKCFCKLKIGIRWGNSRYGALGKNATCKLCKETVETREHVLIDCPALEDTRSITWSRLGPGGGVPDVSVILDHTTSSEPDEKFEQATQHLVYKLHCHRLRALNALNLL